MLPPICPRPTNPSFVAFVGVAAISGPLPDRSDGPPPPLTRASPRGRFCPPPGSEASTASWAQAGASSFARLRPPYVGVVARDADPARPRRRRDVARADEVARAGAQRDELGLERAADPLDLGLELLADAHRALLERLEAARRPLELLLELEDALDPREVEPEVGRHLLDATQPVDVG